MKATAKNRARPWADILRAIPAGESQVFFLESPRQANTVKATVSYLNQNYPERGIRLSAKTDRGKGTITVTATKQ